jgi:hypothetical protein
MMTNINKILLGFQLCQLKITDVSGTISVPIIRAMMGTGIATETSAIFIHLTSDSLRRFY